LLTIFSGESLERDSSPKEEFFFNSLSSLNMADLTKEEEFMEESGFAL
jgi:hypothetical protein